MATIMQSALGIVVFLLAAWTWSEGRSSIPWRVELGFKSIFAGTLATLITGAVAGIML